MSITRLPPGFKITRDTNTEEFFINMGPQHPSTHGALRLALRMDGENIVEVVPHFGYIHRGMEKQAESMSYLQYIAMSDRQDYLKKLKQDLVNTLLELGSEDAVIRQRGQIAVNPKCIECDLFKYLEGDSTMVNSYKGEYMAQYSWAEYSIFKKL